MKLFRIIIVSQMEGCVNRLLAYVREAQRLPRPFLFSPKRGCSA